MTLYMVGLGLYDMADITLRGLEIVKRCDKIYLDNYTAILHTSKEDLEEFFDKEVIYASRECVEMGGNDIIDEAKDKDVAFLVVGDPFGATTHTDLFLRAREKGVHIEVVHNASILSAVGVVGLELYKYGRTTTLVYPDENWVPLTPLEVINDNMRNGMHTLVLLDIKVAENSRENMRKGIDAPEPARFMTVNEGIDVLRTMEEKAGTVIIPEDKIIVGVARLGSCNGEPQICAGTMNELHEADFGKPMHSLIVPADGMHDIEKEMLAQWKC